MMIYLTGSQNSLTKSDQVPQTDTAKSLGGYVSSTPVPNGELNSLFDLISNFTLEKKRTETVGIALINKAAGAVKDVELKIVVEKESLATFKIAAVLLDENLAMEHISNRYVEPMYAEFYNADFVRAYVDIKVGVTGRVNDEILILPINVSVVIEEEGIDGTWAAFEDAFQANDHYGVKRLSENVFRIFRRDEYVEETPYDLTYETSGSFTAEFLGQMKNGVNNSVSLISDDDTLAPNSGIGLWVQRSLKSYRYPTNEKLIEDWKNKIEKSQEEVVEVVISYNLV